jgi:hypothetical protein
MTTSCGPIASCSSHITRWGRIGNEGSPASRASTSISMRPNGGAGQLASGASSARPSSEVARSPMSCTSGLLAASISAGMLSMQMTRLSPCGFHAAGAHSTRS